MRVPHKLIYFRGTPSFFSCSSNPLVSYAKRVSEHQQSSYANDGAGRKQYNFQYVHLFVFKILLIEHNLVDGGARYLVAGKDGV